MNCELNKQKLKVRWKLERQTKRTHNKKYYNILNQINHHWVVKIVQKTTIDMALASMIRKKMACQTNISRDL